MIGGGIGAFIGEVHRMAAALDGNFELVCGALSSDPQKSLESGINLGLDKHRIYPDFRTMIIQESYFPEDERMEIVSIVTPNFMHYEPAKLALEYGFHVVCDKPLCMTLEEAYDLQKTVAKMGKIFALTHNYTGYPMIKQARYFIQSGSLGPIRRVVSSYTQGWLSTFLESEGQKQASWRTDPTKSGYVGAVGDIGTHAENMVSYLTGLTPTEISANLNTVVKGRLLDDDASILLRFDNGATGVILVSQVATGEENNFNVHVSGTEGSLEWNQMDPNRLVVRWKDKPKQEIRTGDSGLCDQAISATRLPAGHPEGYIEAFANIYSGVAKAIRTYRQQGDFKIREYDFPTIFDGVRGMEFIQNVVNSHTSVKKWIFYNEFKKSNN